MDSMDPVGPDWMMERRGFFTVLGGLDPVQSRPERGDEVPCLPVQDDDRLLGGSGTSFGGSGTSFGGSGTSFGGLERILERVKVLVLPLAVPSSGLRLLGSRRHRLGFPFLPVRMATGAEVELRRVGRLLDRRQHFLSLYLGDGEGGR